jgi:hypothetical protein
VPNLYLEALVGVSNRFPDGDTFAEYAPNLYTDDEYTGDPMSVMGALYRLLSVALLLKWRSNVTNE